MSTVDGGISFAANDSDNSLAYTVTNGSDTYSADLNFSGDIVFNSDTTFTLNDGATLTVTTPEIPFTFISSADNGGTVAITPENGIEAQINGSETFEIDWLTTFGLTYYANQNQPGAITYKDYVLTFKDGTSLAGKTSNTMGAVFNFDAIGADGTATYSPNHVVYRSGEDGKFTFGSVTLSEGACHVYYNNSISYNGTVQRTAFVFDENASIDFEQIIAGYARSVFFYGGEYDVLGYTLSNKDMIQGRLMGEKTFGFLASEELTFNGMKFSGDGLVVCDNGVIKLPDGVEVSSTATAMNESDTVVIALESSTSPQVTFIGETASNFSATAENDELNVTFSDVSLIYASGTATYSATGIDFDEGTVFKKIDSSDVFVTFTVNTSDEGKISIESDSGIFVQPSTSDAVKVNLNLSANSNQDYTGINGSATFAGNEIKLGSNTTVEGTANVVNLNKQLPFNYALSGGTGSLGFTENGSKMVADGTATLIGTITNSDTDIVIAINGGGTVSSQLDENRVHNTYLSEGINLTSNGDEYVFILEDAGNYTLNGAAITTTASDVKVHLSNFDTVEFDIDAPVDYSKYKIQGESGNTIQITQNSPSVIMYKQGTVNIEDSTFTLTEDDADGIKLRSSKENEFSVSRVISEDEVEKYGLDASDVGKVFEEVVEIKNDDTFSVQIAGNGIKQLDGLSSNAEIVNTAIFDGEIDPNGNYFFVSTDSEGKFKFGSNTYEISKDDNVTLKIAFDKDGDGTVSEISELIGTISGNFNEIESINDKEITISGGADNATVSVVDEDILIGNIAENATVSFNSDDISVLTTSTEITVNDVTYNISGDNDGVIVGDKSVSGLSADATLKVSEAGRYNVNNTWLNVKIEDIVIAVTKDYAYLFDENNPQFSVDTSVAEIVDGLNIEEEKVQTLALTGDETVTLPDKGKNAAVVPEGSSGTKVIELGDKGNAAIIESTTALVTVTGGAGDDTLISKGENVTFDMAEGGADQIIVTGGKTALENYDPNTGAGIKLTTDDVKAGVKFEDGKVKLANNAEVDFGSDSNRINIFTPDGTEEKIAFVTPENNELDYSDSTEDLVVLGSSESLSSEVESSTLKSGSGNDSIYAGANAFIDAGAGKNYVSLSDDGGATVSATEGKTTLDNFNFVDDGTIPADKLSTESMAITGVKVEDGNVILSNGKTQIQINDAENKNLKFENQYTGGEITAQFGDDELKIDNDATFYWAGGKNATVSIGEDYTNSETATFNLRNSNYKDSDTASFYGDIKDFDASEFSGTAEITGNKRNNVITASKGGSTLDGGKGNDTLIGGEGSDTFIFGTGKDLITNFDTENDKLEAENLAIRKVEVKDDDLIMTTANGKATIEGAADKTIKFENKYTNGTIEMQISDTEATINNDADFYWFSGKNATVVLGSDSTLASANINLANHNYTDTDTLTFYGDIRTLDASEYANAATLSGSSRKNNVIKATIHYLAAMAQIHLFIAQVTAKMLFKMQRQAIP